MAPPHAGGRRQPKKGNFLASFIAFSASVSNLGPVLQVMFRLVSAYSLSQNTIESTKTSRLFHQPNQPLLISLFAEASFSE
jgi:hypothetical protein